MAKADAIAAAKERALQAAHDAAVAAQAAENALAAEIAAESVADPVAEPEPAPAVKAAEAVQVVMHKTYDVESDKRQRAQSPANM